MTVVSTCLNLLDERNRMDLAKDALLYGKKELRLRPNSCLFIILVKYHCRNGDVESAKCIFEEIRLSNCSHSNWISYSTLMDCLCQKCRLEEMVGEDGIVPDELIYNASVNWFVKGVKVDRTRRFIQFMRSKGCPPNVLSYERGRRAIGGNEEVDRGTRYVREIEPPTLELPGPSYSKRVGDVKIWISGLINIRLLSLFIPIGSEYLGQRCPSLFHVSIHSNKS